MNICLWRYLDNTRNYPGYHLSADGDGCRVLREKLTGIVSKATISLNAPDREILEVPNNQAGRARAVSGRKLRVITGPDFPEGHFVFNEEDDTIVLTCSRAQVRCVLAGVEDIEKGKGDYCIGGDRDHVLWFWWQS